MNAGKIIVLIGLMLVVTGILIQYSDKLPFLGRLPGDIRIEKENFKIYIPITSSILISIILTLILYLINKFKN
jgi:hypothetical protein